MKFYGKSEDASRKIVSLFESGAVPTALAPVFVHRHDDLPCRRWSWSNQLLTVLAGTEDARGFRQWEHSGRRVSKGAKAFYILGPVTKKIPRTEDGERRDSVAVVGFKGIPVFRLADTEVADAEKWALANSASAAEKRFVEALPLVEVARAWDLHVDTFSGAGANYLGYYQHGQAIALGVRNASTWAHELCHAADDRNGSLTKRPGQQLDNEVVAELGGAVLLTILGDTDGADYGGCWDYIQRYANKHNVQPISVCEKLLKRTCEAVALILTAADALAPAEIEVAA